MEEIGKLIRELFDDLKKENAELKTACLQLQQKNSKLLDALARIIDIVIPHISKDSDGDRYIAGIYADDANKIFELLGIEITEVKK